MIWRLLTGRLTRASLLTFLIILALRGAYLINKQDALELRQGVLSFMGTPEPTLVMLDNLVLPMSIGVETPTAPLSDQAYEQEVYRLMEEFGASIDSINASITQAAGVSNTSAQHNASTQQLANSLNELTGVVLQIRQLHPPPKHEAFHERLLAMLAIYEKINNAMIADYDQPGSISVEENEHLFSELEQAIETLDYIPPSGRR